MITLKTQKEIESIRQAGSILHSVLTQVARKVSVGVTTLELNDYAAWLIRESGAIPCLIGYKGYKHAICASPTMVAAHGVPNNVPLEGGLINLDIALTYKGFYADSAISMAVGEPTPQLLDLLHAAQSTTNACIAAAIPGNTLHDIAAAAEKAAGKYSIVSAFHGHGIGFDLHEEPQVFFSTAKACNYKLAPGMVLAIEPVLTTGSGSIHILNDGWTALTSDLSPTACFEHTIAITATGNSILTNGRID